MSSVLITYLVISGLLLVTGAVTYDAGKELAFRWQSQSKQGSNGLASRVISLLASYR